MVGIPTSLAALSTVSIFSPWPRSAKSRRSARRNWLRLVTTMRGVDLDQCKEIFLKDSYRWPGCSRRLACRRVQYSEEDLEAEMRGEYVVRSPSEDSEEEEATPRWDSSPPSHSSTTTPKEIPLY